MAQWHYKTNLILKKNFTFLTWYQIQKPSKLKNDGDGVRNTQKSNTVPDLPETNNPGYSQGNTLNQQYVNITKDSTANNIIKPISILPLVSHSTDTIPPIHATDVVKMLSHIQPNQRLNPTNDSHKM